MPKQKLTRGAQSVKVNVVKLNKTFKPKKEHLNMSALVSYSLKIFHNLDDELAVTCAHEQGDDFQIVGIVKTQDSEEYRKLWDSLKFVTISDSKKYEFLQMFKRYEELNLKLTNTFAKVLLLNNQQ